MVVFCVVVVGKSFVWSLFCFFHLSQVRRLEQHQLFPLFPQRGKTPHKVGSPEQEPCRGSGARDDLSSANTCSWFVFFNHAHISQKQTSCTHFSNDQKTHFMHTFLKRQFIHAVLKRQFIHAVLKIQFIHTSCTHFSKTFFNFMHTFLKTFSIFSTFNTNILMRTFSQHLTPTFS